MSWLLSLVLLAGVVQQDEPPTLRVARLWSQYAERMVRQDLDGLADFYTTDARLMEPNQDDLIGRATIRQRIKATMSQTARTTDFRVIPREVLGGSSGFIIDQGDYIHTVATRGNSRSAIDVYGRYFAIWAQQPDETWKIARLMLAPKRQPATR
jgi:ketosteroid isomerase-like protein